MRNYVWCVCAYAARVGSKSHRKNMAMAGEEVENHDGNRTRPPTASGGVEAGGASGSGEGEGAKMRTRLVKTALLNASFIMLVRVREKIKTSMTVFTPYYFFQGFCGASPGPTLLDLRDLYETTSKTIAFLIVSVSIGSPCGSFLCRVSKSAPHFCLKKP